MTITLGLIKDHFSYGFGSVEGYNLDCVKLKEKKYGYQIKIRGSVSGFAKVYFVDIEDALLYIKYIYKTLKGDYSTEIDLDIYDTYKKVKEIYKDRKKKQL